MPHMPQDRGLPLQLGGASPAPVATEEAKTESRFARRLEPQCGQGVPFQSDDLTRTSLSFSQAAQ